MSTEAGFVQALRDDPNDDVARLIYADWLDERDDPRGEFIRVQMRLAGPVSDLDQRTALHHRSAELLAAHASRWLGPLAELATAIEWERGQPHLTLTAAQVMDSRFLPDARKLLDHAIVGRVRIVVPDGLLLGVVSLPILGAMPHLYLDRLNLEDVHVGALLANRSSVGLRKLSLASNRLTDQALNDLARHPIAESLLELDLRNNGMTDRSLQLADRFSGELDLRGNPLTADGHSAHTEARQGLYNGTDRLLNSLGMEFVRIRAGTYVRGSKSREADRYDDEGPRIRVRIARDFYLGVFQVTQAEYERIAGANPAQFSSSNNGGPHHPVEHVSREDAVRFCDLVSALTAERAAGRRYRLPTESEWEWAARAGWDHTPLPADRQPVEWLANFGNALGRTHRVGSYPPTPWGLYDLSGNLWDWCSDYYARYVKPEKEPLIDPTGPDTGEQGVVRGGSWYGRARNVRCACRGSDHVNAREPYFGFRLLLEI